MNWINRLEASGARYPDDLESNILRLTALTVAIDDASYEKKLIDGIDKLLVPILDRTRLSRIETFLRDTARAPDNMFSITESELRSVDARKVSELLLFIANKI